MIWSLKNHLSIITDQTIQLWQKRETKGKIIRNHCFRSCLKPILSLWLNNITTRANIKKFIPKYLHPTDFLCVFFLFFVSVSCFHSKTDNSSLKANYLGLPHACCIYCSILDKIFTSIVNANIWATIQTRMLCSSSFASDRWRGECKRM